MVLARSAAPGKGDVPAWTARCPARDLCEISWEKCISLGPTLHRNQLAAGDDEMDCGCGCRGMAGGLLSQEGTWDLKGTGSQERIPTDSLGTPFNPALAHTCPCHGER